MTLSLITVHIQQLNVNLYNPHRFIADAVVVVFCFPLDCVTAGEDGAGPQRATLLQRAHADVRGADQSGINRAQGGVKRFSAPRRVAGKSRNQDAAPH